MSALPGIIVIFLLIVIGFSIDKIIKLLKQILEELKKNK